MGRLYIIENIFSPRLTIIISKFFNFYIHFQQHIYTIKYFLRESSFFFSYFLTTHYLKNQYSNSIFSK